MSEVKRWLQNRLSPSMAKSERWTDLAKAIEKFWGDYGEPHIDAAERALSVFTADDIDVERKLAELGTKFEVALPITPSSKAMAYSMRSYEIHRKDRQATLEAILQRDFAGAVIRWLPIKAPKASHYGSLFLTVDEVQWTNFKESDLWQTSRGRAAVDLSAAIYYGFTRQTVTEAIYRKLRELKPAHIVFDGVNFFSIHYLPVEEIDFEQGIRCNTSFIGSIDADPFLSLRFDDVPADVCFLDAFSPLRHGERINETNFSTIKVPFRFPWRLDMGWRLGGVWAPVKGVEGDLLHPLHFLSVSAVAAGSFEIDGFSMDVVSEAASKTAHKVDADPIRRLRFDDVSSDLSGLDDGGVGSSHESSSIGVPINALFRFPWRLDMGWRLGGVWAPVKGVEGDLLHPLHFLGDSSVRVEKIVFSQPAISAGSVESLGASVVHSGALAGHLSSSGDTCVVHAAFKSALGDLGDMPSLDDIPIDFFPLDLRYQQHV